MSRLTSRCHDSMSTALSQQFKSALLFVVCVGALAISCSTDSTEPRHVQVEASPRMTTEDVLAAKVVGIVDGVTIDVDVDAETFRVRYLGIDVPGSGPKFDSTITARAHEFNRFRVMGRVVKIERDGIDADDAGRILRYVYIDGEMINKALLAAGYAVVAGFPYEFRHRNSFVQIEESAREDGLGYWRGVDEQNFSKEDLVKDAEDVTPALDPSTVPQFSGGTLPSFPDSGGGHCNFTGTSEAVIKGNVDAATGERTYILPGSIFYSTTVVDPDDGDEWLCTEIEAIAAGWIKMKH